MYYFTTRWSAIASHLPGRTDNEIKNFWNTHLKKKLIQMGFDPMTHQPRTDPFSSLPHLMALFNLRDVSQLDHYHENHHFINRLQFLHSLLLQYSTSASTYGNADDHDDHKLEPYFSNMNTLNSSIFNLPVREYNQMSQNLSQHENNSASLIFSNTTSPQPLHQYNPTLLSRNHLDPIEVPFSSTNSQCLAINGSSTTCHDDDQMGHQGNHNNSNSTLIVSQGDEPPDRDSSWLFIPPLSPSDNSNNNIYIPPNFMSSTGISTSNNTIPGDHASSTSSYGGPSSTSYWPEAFLHDDSIMHEIIL